MTSRRRLAVLALFAAAIAATALYAPIQRRLRSAELLRNLEHAGSVRGEARSGLVEQDVTIAGRAGPIRARLYRSSGTSVAPGLVIAHGVHYLGIDEPRLVPFARELARSGRIVLTPELSDLMDYRITGASVAVIEDAVRWLSERPEVTRRRVGLLGLSFAGGLSLVVAEDPNAAARLEYVTSVGGHDDLERVLRFLVSDRIETPSGVRPMKAHDYGLVVAVYGYLDRFVEAPDHDVLRSSLRAWLHEDRPTARALAAKCSTASCRHVFELVENGSTRELAPELTRILAEHRAELDALSPRGKLARITIPVYLLHGSADNVIPPSETEWAELELHDQPHLCLVSPLIQHVEMVSRASLGDEFALVDFVARIL